MGRTLYLRENGEVTVSVDGPSLWVKEKDRAGYRVPARTVSRVVIYGNFQVTGDFMALFAERGVPVSFQNLRGQALSTALPRFHGQGRVNSLFQAALENAETCAELQNHVHSHRAAMIMKWLLRIRHPLYAQFRSRGISEVAYVETMNSRMGGKSVRDTLMGLLIPMIVDEAVSVLRQSGLDVHRGLRGCDGPFSLAEDFGWMLQAEADQMADHYVLRYGKSTGLKGDRLPRVVTVYESRRRVLVQVIRSTVDDLKAVAMKGDA